ncbi:hypothetical protein [Staphylococcus shinii]|uniref:hypothetical protein n=1 Tax=Staphylococcus shinii TaxID=2912228 RepID=UPI003EEDF1D6
MSNYDREIAKNFLSKNNKEKLNDYINGYCTAATLTKEIVVDRSILYLAISDLDSEATNKRKENKLKTLKELVEMVNLCIPYEQMNLDVERLMGKDSDFLNKPIATQKRRISDLRYRTSQKQIDFDKDFEFILQKKVNKWYRNYLIHKEIEEKVATPYKTAKKYRVDPRKVYEINAFFDEKPNEHKIKKTGVTLEQKQRFLENVKIFEDYEAGHNISELASKYTLSDALIEKIIASIEFAKKSLV